jgi:methylglutaconyl-CoA hydratase
MHAFTTLLVNFADSVATVTLNRPAVRNAFNAVLITELTAVFQTLGQNPEVRIIILAAEGVSFCAGADLNWMKSMASYSYEENIEDAASLAKMLRIIDTTPQPIIAKIQGDVYAGGVGLVAVCDIAVANEESGFCLSEAKLGLIPATISPYVIRAMGVQACRRYFITAERFSAKLAYEMGLVHILTTSVALDSEISKLCKGLLKNGSQAMNASKKLIQDVAFKEINTELISETVNRIAQIRCSSEAQERMQLFLEKK